MTRSISKIVEYPHPIEKVWAALTDRDALSEWLMPTDFEPEVGHEFQFRTDPGPGFDGVVRCEVLEMVEPRWMRWSWKGGPLDTIVTFELTPTGESTRLTFRQEGFEGLSGLAVSWILRGGFGQMYERALPAVLAGRPVPPRMGMFASIRHRLLTRKERT